MGKIEYEYDDVTEPVRKEKGSRAVIFDGSATIRDVNREFEWSLPDGYYATIAGLVIHESQTIVAHVPPS